MKWEWEDFTRRADLNELKVTRHREKNRSYGCPWKRRKLLEISKMNRDAFYSMGIRNRVDEDIARLCGRPRSWYFGKSNLLNFWRENRVRYD